VFTEAANVQDYAELKSATNMTEVNICWGKGHSIEDILPVLKRWRQLRRLTLQNKSSVPQFKVICDFIKRMKYLTYLQLSLDCAQPEILRDEVNQIVLPLRPNFDLNVKSVKY
jgi:hypothetical protein